MAPARRRARSVDAHARRALRGLATRLGIAPETLAAACLALVAAVVVFALATRLFPYHSLNHDEGVYLRQAAMLLDGKLTLRPSVPGAFRPWFFVRRGDVLFPKYTPVPAAVFAVGKALLGSFRASLALVAAANVLLVYGTVAEAFDDRLRGLLAAAFVLASPLYLLDSAVFLPYAPVTALNLLFALAYLRGARRTREDRSATGTRAPLCGLGYPLLAGTAIGLAFFARPYTAVLFAAPFVCHAGYRVVASGLDHDVVAGHLATAVVGLVFVGLALGYNAALTGDPLLFPYQAFSPRDGLGFGTRQLLDYARTYTPGLAVRANAAVVSDLFANWVAGGLAGTALAVVGLGAFARAWTRSGRDGPDFERGAQAVLAALFVSVVAGNILFWGNLNVLGRLAVPDDGLVAFLGPYYHFDLLLPTAAFAAHGSLVAVDRVRREASDRTPERAGQVVAVVALAGLLVVAAGTAAALAPPLGGNAGVTRQYEQAYHPFETRNLDGVVVFLPTPYGNWLGHPFQALRNEPDFAGTTVYALAEGGTDLAVAAAYPDRRYYRYVYRGEWSPASGRPVDARLQRLSVVRGERIRLDATVAVPAHVEDVSIRVATDGGHAYYAVAGTPATLSFAIDVADGRVRLAGPDVTELGRGAGVPTARTDTVTVEVFLDGGHDSGLSYRFTLPVARAGDGTTALTPAVEACRQPRRCGGEAAYLPNVSRAGNNITYTLSAANGTGGPSATAERAESLRQADAHDGRADGQAASERVEGRLAEPVVVLDREFANRVPPRQRPEQ